MKICEKENFDKTCLGTSDRRELIDDFTKTVEVSKTLYSNEIVTYENKDINTEITFDELLPSYRQLHVPVATQT